MDTINSADVLIQYNAATGTQAKKLQEYLRASLGNGIELADTNIESIPRYALILLIEPGWSPNEHQNHIHQILSDKDKRLIPVLVDGASLPENLPATLSILAQLAPSHVQGGVWQERELERIAKAIEKSAMQIIQKDIEANPVKAPPSDNDSNISDIELPRPRYFRFTLQAILILGISFAVWGMVFPLEDFTNPSPRSTENMITMVALNGLVGIIGGALLGQLYHSRLPDFKWKRLSWALLYGLVFGVAAYSLLSVNIRLLIPLALGALAVFLLSPILSLWLPLPPRWYRFTIRVLWQVPIMILQWATALIMGVVAGAFGVFLLVGSDPIALSPSEMRFALIVFMGSIGVMLGLIAVNSTLSYYRSIAVSLKLRRYRVVEPIREARRQRNLERQAKKQKDKATAKT